MDDVLGDFFSEIESIQTEEQVVSADTEKHVSGQAISSLDSSSSSSLAVEVKTVKAVPHITYAPGSKVNCSIAGLLDCLIAS